MVSNNFDLHVHHGKQFVNSRMIEYSRVREDVVENIDLDFFGRLDLEDIIRRLQYGNGFILHYKVPGRCKDDGWKVIDSDSGVMELVRVHQPSRQIHICIEHLVDKVLIVETPNNEAKKNVKKEIEDSTSESGWKRRVIT